MSYDLMAYVIAFAITLLAGLATGIGGFAVLNIKQSNIRYLSLALGLSAGVMIYVSFMELLPEGRDRLISHFGDKAGGWMMILAFFVGIALIAIIDKVIPEPQNPHEPRSLEDIEECQSKNGIVCVQDVPHALVTESQAILAEQEKTGVHSTTDLYRTGIFSALAIAIHNFPEGLATFISTLADPALGFTIAVAIAIHNIPEGISVAVPIYYATGSRRKAVRYALLSGLAEPVGALVGALILLPFLNDAIMGFVFAAVAGIMVYISIDELLPSAEKYGEHHFAIYGLIAGMAIMALSLQLL